MNEKEVEMKKSQEQKDDELTQLNIELNTKHRRYKALIEEKKKLEDLILKHDQEKLTITKTLETKLEEKEQRINQYEARLN